MHCPTSHAGHTYPPSTSETRQKDGQDEHVAIQSILPVHCTTYPCVRNWGAQPTWVQPLQLTTKATVTSVPSVAQQRIVTRHAINILTIREKASFNAIHVPTKLMREASIPIKFEHYANPMVHLVTGKTISSFKQLMNDLATAEVWQTAFGKDFGSMAQGNNKTGQRGTNAMFVMTRDEVAHALTTGHKKKIRTASKSQPEAICLNMRGMHPYRHPTSTRPKCIGTAL